MLNTYPIRFANVRDNPKDTATILQPLASCVGGSYTFGAVEVARISVQIEELVRGRKADGVLQWDPEIAALAIGFEGISPIELYKPAKVETFTATYRVTPVTEYKGPHGGLRTSDHKYDVVQVSECSEPLAIMTGRVKAMQQAGWQASLYGRADVMHVESGNEWTIRCEQTRTMPLPKGA